MIQHIKLLQNIGTFNSDSAAESLELKRLSLVYADNARGKTTIAAVLRSLATDDPLPIAERHRFGSQHPPKVALTCQDEPSDILFQGGGWNKTLTNIKVFDEYFVDENVYSGLAVDARHRQNLHELILGDKGVALNRRLRDYVSLIANHNTDLEAKSRAIPEHVRFGLLVDKFCALPMVPDIDEKIDAADRELKAAQDQDVVRTAPLFEGFKLPTFHGEAIKEILSKSLPSLDEEAEAKVQAHIQSLGEGGESWVSDGLNRGLPDSNGACPFCGQGLTGVELLAHYRAYFGAAYAELKQDVAKKARDFDHDHSEVRRTSFENAVSKAQQSAQFWARYSDVPPIEVETEAILQNWSITHDTVAALLTSKQAAPLDQLELDGGLLDAIATYDTHMHEISAINQTLLSFNERISEIKDKVSTADLAQLGSQLNALKATKARFRDDVAPLCDDYLEEQQAKACTEAERTEARNALEEYRAGVFPRLQDGVNAYLERFNAGFRVGSLVPANIGGGSGSTCTYNVVINNTPIAVRNSNNPPGEPSFRNTLSAGDRNTLALGLFFSALDQRPDLSDTIVVIDDPMSSLDDHRSLATVQTVRKLVERAKQVIVMSHNKRFLCGIWRGANRKECQALEIAQSGEHSTIRRWEVSQDAVTEHDQRFFLLHGYATVQSGDSRQVATAIRLHLEGYLRVACPGEFPAGKLLGPFIGECHEKVGKPAEVIGEKAISELEDIQEYGNRFHHDTNLSWETADINPTELLGFVRRTLAFVGLEGRSNTVHV